MSDKETITITLKRTHGSAQSIDGFGELKAGVPREARVDPHVANRLRAMSMFDVDPPQRHVPQAKKIKKKEDS